LGINRTSPGRWCNARKSSALGTPQPYLPARAGKLRLDGARGSSAAVQRGDWLPLLAAAGGSSAITAGVCTGTMLLAHAGAIGNRRAGTHHSAWDDLAATGATVVKDRVVDDGDLITSGGVTSGVDLALWL
jgi:transcriptional regulator GlxA family with amidase domain